MGLFDGAREKGHVFALAGGKILNGVEVIVKGYATSLVPLVPSRFPIDQKHLYTTKVVKYRGKSIKIPSHHSYHCKK